MRLRAVSRAIRVLMIGKARGHARRVSMMGKGRRREGAQGKQFSRLRFSGRKVM